MKFINTVTFDLINVDEISIVSHEEFNNVYYSYFYLKNGQKYDASDCPESFLLEPGTDYWFDAQCHNILNRIILRMAMELDENDILDVSEKDADIWALFLHWARNNKELLCKRTRKIDE